MGHSGHSDATNRCSRLKLPVRSIEPDTGYAGVLMIPEIDIWRAATLMLRRYGDKALEESATRADQLEAEGDPEGAATWRWIARAIEQLANTTPPGQVH